MIYHASFTDEEALDMLEASRDRIFVAPGLSVIERLLFHGDIVGISHAKARRAWATRRSSRRSSRA